MWVAFCIKALDVLNFNLRNWLYNQAYGKESYLITFQDVDERYDRLA